MKKTRRAGLKKAIAKRMDVSAAQVDTFITAFVDQIIEELEAGNGVLIPGFLSLAMKDGKMLTCRNPRTGERMFVHTLPSIKTTVSKSLRLRLGGGQGRHTVVYLPDFESPDFLLGVNNSKQNNTTHIAQSFEEAQALLLDLPVSLLVVHDGIPPEEYSALSMAQKIQGEVIHPHIAGISLEGEFGYPGPHLMVVPDFVFPAETLRRDPVAFALALEQIAEVGSDVKLLLRVSIMPEPEAIGEFKVLLTPLLHQCYLKSAQAEAFLSAIEEVLDWCMEVGMEHSSGNVEITYLEATDGVTLRIQAREPLFLLVGEDSGRRRVQDFRRSIIDHGCDETEYAEDGTNLMLRKRGSSKT